MRQLFEIIKVSRPGFWPTHIWFYVLPFAQQDMFGSVAFWLGAVYVCFPMGLLAFGWNDLGDVDTDSVNERKDSWLFGARPDQATRKRLPWIIAATQAPFMIAFVVIAGWQMLIWFAAFVAANACYNTFGFKRIPWLDLLNQIGYLLVFVMASWLCHVSQLNTPAMIYSALFAMHSHLFGQIMDIDEDREGGRNTTAVAIGITPGKFLLAGLLAAEAVIAFVFFQSALAGVFSVIACVFFLADAMLGPKKYPLWFVTAFFIGWNGVVIATIHFIWRYGIFIQR